MLDEARMQVSAASKFPPNNRKRVHLQMCVQVIAFIVGPKGGMDGFEIDEEAIALANRFVESRAARIHCSMAFPLTSGGHDVVRLWR